MLALALLAGCSGTESPTQGSADYESIGAATDDGSDEDDSTDTTTVTDHETTQEPDDLGDVWVDVDSPRFSIDGHVYTLGVTTLQDLIDDGAPFDETDLENANNNVPAGSESSCFRLVLDEETAWTANLFFANHEDHGAPASSLPVTFVYLYIPEGRTQDVLAFGFPLDMTAQDLVDHAGVPDENYYFQSEEDESFYYYTLSYWQDPQSTFTGYGYEFEFTCDVFSGVTLYCFERAAG